jgi:hypothetical protein
MADQPDTGTVDVMQSWGEVVDALEGAMPPEWTKFARESADTSWMRAMLLLDAHDRLGRPTPTEHISHTLHHLAASNKHEVEAKGWEALHDKRREERRQMLLLIEERGPGVLDGEPAELFARSIVPVVISAPAS